MTNRLRVQGLMAALAITGLISLVATTASADPRSMIGSLLVENPSAGYELPPAIYGKKVGGAGPRTFPPAAALPSLSVDGTTPGTFVGRQVTLPASELRTTGFEFRLFPAFANVVQVSKSYMSLHGQATFAENQGALAACPGDGCTSSGAGTAISWCPPVSHNPTAPAPGTTGAPIGNWDCPSWQGGAGGGDRFLRMAITNGSARNNFGGTFLLLRNFAQNVWRAPVPPSTPNASDAEVTRSWMDIDSQAWSGGRSNFEYTGLGGNNGPRLFARLTASGGLDATFGCTNGVGTNGGNYVRSNPITNAGSNCGTDPSPNAEGQGWGFKMTTGTISGSDPYPFGAVVTTVAGTPFNPTFGTQATTQGFFFSRQGTDSLTTTPAGGGRNIVMLGGGISVDPDSGNAFFRITRLEMNLVAPEPATGAALAAGLGGLAWFARRRTRK